MDRWFGGGTDLSLIFFEEDAGIFTSVQKTCDAFDPAFYPASKTLRHYFVNWHRNEERRGRVVSFTITSGQQKSKMNVLVGPSKSLR